MKREKVLGVVQARMSSERLPGKVLLPHDGKPLLRYVSEILQQCQTLDSWLVATSTERADDAIADFCQQNKILCFRGSLERVASRFQGIVDQYSPDGFVRISADSPLHDPRLIDEMVLAFRASDCDLLTNVWPRSFPKGRSVEIVDSRSFSGAFPAMTSPEDQEHVTRYFYQNAGRYRIVNFASDQNFADINLCVDSPEDWQRFISILGLMQKPHWEYSLEEIVEVYKRVCQS